MFRECLDKPRFLSRVAQRISKFFDRSVQTVIEGNEGVLGPKSVTQLIPGNDFARVLQQQRKQAERLLLQLYFDAVLVQFSRTEVNIKGAEAHEPSRLSGSNHKPSEWMEGVYHLKTKRIFAVGESLVSGSSLVQFLISQSSGKDKPPSIDATNAPNEYGRG